MNQMVQGLRRCKLPLFYMWILVQFEHTHNEKTLVNSESIVFLMKNFQSIQRGRKKLCERVTCGAASTLQSIFCQPHCFLKRKGAVRMVVLAKRLNISGSVQPGSTNGSIVYGYGSWFAILRRHPSTVIPLRK